MENEQPEATGTTAPNLPENPAEERRKRAKMEREEVSVKSEIRKITDREKIRSKMKYVIPDDVLETMVFYNSNYG